MCVFTTQLCQNPVWAHTHTHTPTEKRVSLAAGCASLTYGLPNLLNDVWGLAASYIMHQQKHTSGWYTYSIGTYYLTHVTSTRALEWVFKDKKARAYWCFCLIIYVLVLYFVLLLLERNSCWTPAYVETWVFLRTSLKAAIIFTDLKNTF